VELPPLIHHPGHRLGVGVHVRRRDVARRAEHELGAIDEQPRDALALGHRQLPGGAVHAALCPPERDAGDGGLPGHELRERAHVVEVDVGVEP
jgi:hypothetical protein